MAPHTIRGFKFRVSQKNPPWLLRWQPLAHTHTQHLHRRLLCHCTQYNQIFAVATCCWLQVYRFCFSLLPFTSSSSSQTHNLESVSLVSCAQEMLLPLLLLYVEQNATAISFAPAHSVSTLAIRPWWKWQWNVPNGNQKPETTAHRRERWRVLIRIRCTRHRRSMEASTAPG